MSYSLGKLSKSRLIGVNPSLVKIVERAIQITNVDFIVVQGMRSREECMVNWGKGRTVSECSAFGIPAQYSKPAHDKVTWLNNPFASKHTKGLAVDLAPWINGDIDWKDLNKFKAISDAMKQASKELNLAIQWGGDFKKNKDSPHYEL